MKIQRTIAALILCSLPTFAMAEPPSDRGRNAPHAEGDRRAHARKIMEHLKIENPEKYAHMMKLRKTDPEEFRRAMGGLLRHRKNMVEVSPELRAAKEQLTELHEDFKAAIGDYRSANAKEQTVLKEELQGIAEEIFAAKQTFRRMKLKKLKTDLSKLESEIAEREAMAEELIESFVSKRIDAELRGL